MDRGAWPTTVHGVEESDMTERLACIHTHIHRRLLPEGAPDHTVPQSQHTSALVLTPGRSIFSLSETGKFILFTKKWKFPACLVKSEDGTPEPKFLSGNKAPLDGALAPVHLSLCRSSPGGLGKDSHPVPQLILALNSTGAPM